jgi:protocatechuate 3,4-dioxygenase beta subunit
VAFAAADCGRAGSESGGGNATAPQAAIAAADTTHLCDSSEPGTRLIFSGRVLDYGGRPLSKAAVVAYHTNAQGLYNPPDSPTRVPRIRDVAITDANGAFCFSTVRPGAYSNGTEPAHIHMAISAPAHHVRYVDYWFEDDPLLTKEMRERAARIDVVIVRTVKNQEGVETFSHEIRLEGN